jgi:endonuclease/exonuclease/phosphatase family metal-dependent hydrolase
MLVLTWNLFHGRSVPDSPHELLDEFAALLAGWDWDVALLQEVPPWWPRRLGAACLASARVALTSRNWFLPVTRLVAQRRPDVIKSWGGGCNAILVRGERVLDHRVLTLRRWPERRVVHGVRLERGWWICNLHAQAHREARAQADVARAAAAAIAWAEGAPVVMGGDLNTRQVRARGFTVVAGNGVDHVLARLARAAAPGRTLDRGRLSDHAPVLAEVG